MAGLAFPAPAGGSVDELVAAYKASRWYREKAASTRDNYDERLAVIARWAVDAPVASITPKRIQTLYGELRPRTPSMDRAVVVMIRILWKFAIADVRADRNPAAVTGHSLKQIETIIDTYLVRTERLARNAFAKRVASEDVERERRR